MTQAAPAPLTIGNVQIPFPRYNPTPAQREELLGDALNTKSKIRTPMFRGSFLKIWKPDVGDDGRKRYGLTAVIDPALLSEHDKALMFQWWKLYNLIKDDKWPDKRGRHGAQAGLKLTFRDDSTYDLTKHPYYEGKLMVGMSSYDRQPGVLDRFMNEISEQGDVYSGAFFKAAITMYPYSHAGGGIAVGLSSLLKVRDGEPLVATNNPVQEFSGIDLSEYPVDNEHLMDGDGGNATDPLLSSLGL